MKIISTILTTLIAQTVAIAQPNLIVNGSFEIPVLNSQTPSNAFSGYFSFQGWSGYSTGNGTTSSSGIVNASLDGPPALDGNQTFSLNGGNPPPGSLIEQAFTTTIGQQYTLSFGTYRYGDQSVAVQLDAEIFDQSMNTLINATIVPQSNAEWLITSVNFTADDTLLRLRFTDTSPSNPNTDLFLDAVSITEIPEPATLSFLLFGVIIIAVKKQTANQRCC